MLKYDEVNGYRYFSNGKTYDLLEGKSYKGRATSDIIFVLDPIEDKVITFFYGATGMKNDEKELLECCKIYIDGA